MLPFTWKPVTVPVLPEVTSESSTAARVVFSMSLMVRDSPRPAATDVLCPTAIDSEAEPATASISERSSAVTRIPPPIPSRVVSLLPLRARAWFLTRILLTEADPARLPAMALPEPEPVTLPAAPTARAKIWRRSRRRSGYRRPP